MFTFLLIWWSRLLSRFQDIPPAERDNGSLTENVIWIAAMAALAILVSTLFRNEIIAAARNVQF